MAENMGEALASEPKNKKKAKPDLEPRLLPQVYREHLANKGVDLDESNLKLIFIRQLYKTDVSQHHTRLSMPCTQVNEEFLTEEDEANLRARVDVKVEVIEPLMEETTMNLARWNLGNSCCFALTNGWSFLVQRNRLLTGDVIQVWSFRFGVENKLGFLIHKVESGGGDESDGSGSSADRVVRSDGSGLSQDRVAKSDGSSSSGDCVARLVVSTSSGDCVARLDGSGSSGGDGFQLIGWGSQKRRGWTAFYDAIFSKHQRV